MRPRPGWRRQAGSNAGTGSSAPARTAWRRAAHGDTVHHPGTDEKGPRASETARDTDDTDGLGHVLPVAVAGAHTMGEMQLVHSGAQANPCNPLAVARPLHAALPAGAQ